MKTFVRFAIVACLLVAAAGSVTAAGSSEESVSNRPVDLRFMLWDSTQRDTYEISIAKFEEQNPNITISMDLSGWGQYWQKLLTEIAGGTAADIFWNQITYFPTLIESNVLLDLKPYIDRDGIDLSKYDETVLQIFQHEGKIYTIAKDRDVIVLIYNKDLFDEAGLPYPDSLDWNPDDGGSLLSLAQQLTVDRNGRTAAQSGFDRNAIDQYGIVSDARGQVFYHNFLKMNGGGIQRAPLSSEFLLDTPETTEALQFLADLVHTYAVSPVPVSGDASAAARQAFYTGRVAMLTDGCWALKTYLDNSQFNWGVAPLPVGPEGRISITNGIGESINVNSPHKEEAWTALKFFASETNHEIFAQTGNLITSMKSMAPLYLEFWDQQGVDASAVIETLNGTTALSSSSRGWNEINASISKYHGLVFLGEMTAEAAGDAIMADIGRILGN